MSTARIDAHHHLWHYTRGKSAFLDAEEYTAIQRDYEARELGELIEIHGFDGTVVVQADQTLEETRFMLAQAEQNAFIKAVVGWVDLGNPASIEVLESWAGHPLFRGIRPEFTGDAVLVPEHAEVIAALERLGLGLDLMAFPGEIGTLVTLAGRHPDLSINLNHCGYSEHGDDSLEPWRSEMRALSEQTDVTVKFSGVMWRLPPHWRNDLLFQAFDHLLETFGPGRLMWASDWPHMEAHSNYAEWTSLSGDYLSRLSDTEQAAIFGATATRTYRL
ncbi:MAG: amidohydrolase family protein [Alphaproteobacteria bacterium]|nr:amidohydrolase family protein [Alphaproteobacteria bacterium]